MADNNGDGFDDVTGLPVGPTGGGDIPFDVLNQLAQQSSDLADFERRKTEWLAQQDAMKQIAALTSQHPDWEQISSFQWKDPANRVYELGRNADGSVKIVQRTVGDSKAILADLGGDGTPSGGASGGTTSSGTTAAPKQSAYQRVMIGGKPYTFNPNTGEYTAANVGGGQYYGFNTPEEAQAYAASIANASPEQLAALQQIAQQSGGSSGGSSNGVNAYDQQISQANLDLAYAKMTFDEKQQAAQLQYQYMNAGLDANAARQQALATLIANKNNNATNVAQASQQAAAQAAQFAANPRDAVAELMYRNAQGLTSTPMGSTDNPAFGDYQNALSQKFMDLFGGAAGDMQKARDQRDAPLPGEFSNPISVNAPQLSTSTYKAPQLGAVPTPAQATNPLVAQLTPQAAQAYAAYDAAKAAPKAPAQDANRANMIKAYAAYHPEDAAAQMQAAWLAYHPDEAIPFAKGGTITMGKPRKFAEGGTVGVAPPAMSSIDQMRRKQVQDAIAAAFNTRTGEANFNAAYDINGDGILNSLDLMRLANGAPLPPQLPSGGVNPGPINDFPMPPKVGGEPPAGGGVNPGPINDTGLPNPAPLPTTVRGVWNGTNVTHPWPGQIGMPPFRRGRAYPGAPSWLHPNRTPVQPQQPSLLPNPVKPGGDPRSLPVDPIRQQDPRLLGAPQQFAMGGEIGQTMEGYRPASSSGGTNMNIHELSYVVGAKSGHIYATLGEHGYPEQLKITPTKEGKEYAQMLDKQKKMSSQGGDGDQQMAKQFAGGGTVTIGADFIAGLRKSLMGYDQQAQAVGGQALPDPRLLAAGVYNQTQHDPNLKGYIESAYSSQGISPEQLWATIDQFRPQGMSNTSVRYQ